MVWRETLVLVLPFPRIAVPGPKLVDSAATVRHEPDIEKPTLKAACLIVSQLPQSSAVIQ